MEQKQQHIKGIRIRRASFLMMVLSGLLFFIIWYSTAQVSAKAHNLTSATDAYIYCEENALQISDASNYLTEQARFYVLSGEDAYADNYFSEIHTVQRREQALENLSGYPASQEGLSYLELAVEESNLLSQREVYAIKLVALAQQTDITVFPQEIQDMVLSDEDMALTSQEKLDKAHELVFGTEYEQAKTAIEEDIAAFITTITQRTYETQQLEHLIYLQEVGVLFLFLINVLTFTLLILLVAKPLRAFIQSIQSDKALNIQGSYECQYLATTYNRMYHANAKSQRILRHRADHDPLTKLFNRGAFERQRQLLHDQDSEPIAFLLVDVDQFKQINDTYGHEVGDRVLKKISHLLQAGFRTNDFVARLGGDEFGVIMMKMTPENRSVIVKKIDAFNELLLHDEHSDLPKVSLTVGVAFSQAGFTSELFSQADQALYQRKENGRCGCQFFCETETV
jgi:diguanylate cyclase (GGDEF)-like protein